MKYILYGRIVHKYETYPCIVAFLEKGVVKGYSAWFGLENINSLHECFFLQLPKHTEDNLKKNAPSQTFNSEEELMEYLNKFKLIEELKQ